ncbi:MAG: hypothetical protein ACFE0I_16465 [Elainellaceae cyanobacterium]
MTNTIPHNQAPSVITVSDRTPESFLCQGMLRSGIWVFGIPSWLFGVLDRGVAAFADGYLTAVEIANILTVSLLFVSWIYLKPDERDRSSDSAIDSRSGIPLDLDHQQLANPRFRSVELPEQHMIEQDYILPFPYVCQIYHLLNLKHLEDIHSLSLSNLKVVGVGSFQPTDGGGRLKFQTVLDSPFNVLRIWRQPIVEVELILHTLHTVELRIPVYGDKELIVLFNVLPLNVHEHRLFVDIYSSLNWPRPVLQFLLNFASRLTLLEDLPYLRALTKRNVHRLTSATKVSSHETMQLFKRFVDLYGSVIEVSCPIETVSVDRLPSNTKAPLKRG